MKKILTLAIAGSVMATSAMAVTRTASVWYVEALEQKEIVYTTESRCSIQSVPMYSNVETRSSTGGDVLAGMVIGALIGKGLTGDDGGAAAGAVMGGVIGADKGSVKNEQVVTGYRQQEVCTQVSIPVESTVNKYIVHWKRNNLRGYFYSDRAHRVGDRVYVDVPNGH